ncbi:hypothetical protein [Streptomyces subrutilus]|uniref:Uncharacterized protein n=1 Tax=Streptomyces subrutilus TaxID=36818 RepID=A0A918VHS9_9ACTN|nr:hypothetical protein [Streptomyces subrutilus]WSJ27838.1 hypothetical protein OG479_00240 [Streptomyces subrutilus]GGZ98725.1 hypothetical protein GCM10010371_67910 [Streptomyces subrutilus]
MGFDHTLRLRNESGKTKDFAVFQRHPAVPKDGLALAWFVKTIHDNAKADDSSTFQWNEVYSFVWSQTGKLNEQVRFESSDEWPAAPDAVKTSSTRTKAGDQVNLVKSGNAYTFQEVAKPQDLSTKGLAVLGDKSIVDYEVSAGLAMYGSPFFVVQAEPSWNWVFTPDPQYWIVATTQVQGDAISATGSSNAFKVDFSRSADVTVVYNNKNEFSQQ